jgi:hypothetical protein
MVGPVTVRLPIDGYMLLSELARLFAVDPSTIRRRLRALGLSLYSHPSDRRLRLVREEDIRAIFRISRAPQRSGTTKVRGGSDRPHSDNAMRAGETVRPSLAQCA